MNFIINLVFLSVAQMDLLRIKSDALLNFLEADYEALNEGKVLLRHNIYFSLSLTQFTMKYY